MDGADGLEILSANIGVHLGKRHAHVERSDATHALIDAFGRGQRRGILGHEIFKREARLDEEEGNNQEDGEKDRENTDRAAEYHCQAKRGGHGGVECKIRRLGQLEAEPQCRFEQEWHHRHQANEHDGAAGGPGQCEFLNALARREIERGKGDERRQGG